MFLVTMHLAWDARDATEEKTSIILLWSLTFFSFIFVSSSKIQDNKQGNFLLILCYLTAVDWANIVELLICNPFYLR